MTLSLREQLLAAGFKPSKDAKPEHGGARGKGQGPRPGGAPRERGDRSQQNVQQRPAGAPPRQGAPRPHNAPPDPQRLAQRQQAERFAREQEQGRKLQEKEQRRARAAELRALIDRCALPLVAGEDWYNFVDEGRVRRIAVNPALREQIMQGELLIARCSDRYDLVPAAAADALRQQHPEALVALRTGAAAATGAASDPGGATGAAQGDDPYKDFVVPDDLTW